MTLFPNRSIIDRVIGSWKGYSDILPQWQRREFDRMMSRLYSYATAIEVKAKPFENDPIFMSLIIDQDNIISWLLARVEELEREKETKI